MSDGVAIERGELGYVHGLQEDGRSEELMTDVG